MIAVLLLGTASLCGALALLTAGFVSTAAWNWVYAVLVCGALMAVSLFKFRWLANLGFLGLVVCCAGGAWLKWQPLQYSAALILTLAAWDLAGFAAQMRLVNDRHPQMPGRHLIQSAAVIGLGAVLGWLAYRLDFGLNFETALILIVVATLGLAQAVRTLRDREEN